MDREQLITSLQICPEKQEVLIQVDGRLFTIDAIILDYYNEHEVIMLEGKSEIR